VEIKDLLWKTQEALGECPENHVANEKHQGGDNHRWGGSAAKLISDVQDVVKCNSILINLNFNQRKGKLSKKR